MNEQARSSGRLTVEFRVLQYEGSVFERRLQPQFELFGESIDDLRQTVTHIDHISIIGVKNTFFITK